MAYLCVDKDGTEIVFERKPIRNNYDKWTWLGDRDRHYYTSMRENFCELPKGSIAKLIGRELTWGDEPVMIE